MPSIPTKFAIDTNILVYAYNVGSPFHPQASQFLIAKMNQTDEFGNLTICISQQSCIEFINSISWQRIENPLSIEQAVTVVNYLVECGLEIIHPQPTQILHFNELITKFSSRKRIFDTAIATTLKDNGIQGIYTVNVKDFQNFDFLTVINPLS